MRIVVACVIDAEAGGNAVPRKGHGVEVVLRHRAQHRDRHHPVVGVQKLCIYGLGDRLGLIPHGGIHALHKALRLGDGLLGRCGRRGYRRFRRRSRL